MSEITRLCSNYELTTIAALRGTEAADCKAAIIAHVAAIGAQRDAAVAACVKLAEAANCDDHSKWDDLLAEATVMALDVVAPAENAPAESSS